MLVTHQDTKIIVAICYTNHIFITLSYEFQPQPQSTKQSIHPIIIQIT